MSVHVDVVAFAEGIAFDMRGNPTVVNFNPQVLFVEQFPAQVAPTLLAILEELPVSVTSSFAGKNVTFSIEVKGPDEEVLFFVRQQQTLQERTYPSLPARMQLMAQIPFPVAKRGTYTAVAHISIPGEPEIVAQKSIVVSDQESLKATGVGGDS